MVRNAFDRSMYVLSRTQLGSFDKGRHGMRQHPGIAQPRNPIVGLEKLGISLLVSDFFIDMLAEPKLPAHMTVAESRLPIRAEIDVHYLLDCNSSHKSHDVNTQTAVVEACISCHDDDHTNAFEGSSRHRLVQAEQAGYTPSGTDVSCASCHVPKIENGDLIITNHIQNDNLRPNEKMIRSARLDCHGLGFTLDALADRNLINSNFRGMPTVQVHSLAWATRRATTDELVRVNTQ